MTKPFHSLLIALSLVALSVPSGVYAQMDFSLEDAEGGGEGDSDMEFSVDEAEGDGSADEGSGTGDVIGDLAAADDTGLAGEAEIGERPEEATEEIYAIQQIYALRLNRAELALSGAFNVNDAFQQHLGASVAVNYWWTNVLAVGANMVWYDFSNRPPSEEQSDLAFDVQRNARLAIPLTEWQMGANLNFTYVPIYGKFAAFNKFIFQWDAYLVGGVGIMRTRPLPIIDPEVREFNDFGNRLQFNAGIGLRIFLSRWLTFYGEFRNYMFLERFENNQVALGADRADSSTWLNPENTLFHNASMHVGITIYFPPSFEYRHPK